MIIYIAGPMSGKPDYNRPAFMEAQKYLESKGHIVLNPASLPIGLPEKSYMPICMAMLEQADAIYMLERWEDSVGARAEYLYAGRQGKYIGFAYDEGWRYKGKLWPMVCNAADPDDNGLLDDSREVHL